MIFESFHKYFDTPKNIETMLIFVTFYFLIICTVCCNLFSVDNYMNNQASFHHDSSFCLKKNTFEKKVSEAFFVYFLYYLLAASSTLFKIVVICTKSTPPYVKFKFVRKNFQLNHKLEDHPVPKFTCFFNHIQNRQISPFSIFEPEAGF